VVVALVVVLAAAGIAAGAAVLALGPRCDLDALRPARIGQNTFVYAADGSLLGVIPAERNRQVVPLAHISPWLTRATVAIEDRRFYDHGGIDAEGIMRALWRDLKAGSVVEGGSTITQQLVRTLYISNERTVERKVTEACLAVKLDDAWSKERILASYLNSVFYGNLAYGAEAASRTYFSKSARWLTLPQAALLAGLTQAPTTYDPLADPVRAVARRNQVLTAMLQERMITQGQYAWARRQPVGLRPGRLYEQIREPYFFGYVRDQLVKAYGAETVRSGGLEVYTTIEPRWQRLARQAIGGTLTRRTDPAAALVSINPANGAIRAMTAIVPGRANNQFNLLSQARRQPGSTFKTFVLTAAVERGMDPSSTYYVSAPFTYRPSAVGNCDDGSWWCVRTYDQSYTGWTSVERATLRSDNSVYAQLTLDVGPARVASLARRLGVRTPLEVRGQVPPALGLGSVAVSPLDMASAYATLAAGGIYNEPTAIRRVVVKGKTDDRWASHHRRTRVLSDGVASVVTRILEDNVRYGTGTRTPGSSATRPVSRRPSGWATRAVRYRWRTCTASPSRAGRSRRRSGAASWTRRSPASPPVTSPPPRRPSRSIPGSEARRPSPTTRTTSLRPRPLRRRPRRPRRRSPRTPPRRLQRQRGARKLRAPRPRAAVPPSRETRRLGGARRRVLDRGPGRPRVRTRLARRLSSRPA
jgi:penicillin-binding protein 1A